MIQMRFVPPIVGAALAVWLFGGAADADGSTAGDNGFPNTVVATIPGIGDSPRGIAVDPTGEYIYVALRGDDEVAVVRTTDLSVVERVPVGDGPVGVAITPDGEYLYVSNTEDNTVSVIHTLTRSVVAVVPIPASAHFRIAVSPDGTAVYVSPWVRKALTVIRTADNVIETTISLGGFPYGIAFAPGGQLAYIANRNNDSVQIVRTSDHQPIGSIAVDDGPDELVVSPDGAYIYVAHRVAASVWVLRTADHSVAARISTGSSAVSSFNVYSAEGLAITPSGDYVYSANNRNGTVDVISTSESEVVASVPVGGALREIAVLPNGEWVFVSITDGDSVAVIGREYDTGGPCEYVDIPGRATILSLAQPSPDGNNCADDSVEVTFDFEPDDSVRYGVPWWPDSDRVLTVAEGANPPFPWVLQEGLIPGTQHRCVRREIVSGTCVPVLFSFTDLDLSKGAEMCSGGGGSEEPDPVEPDPVEPDPVEPDRVEPNSGDAQPEDAGGLLCPLLGVAALFSSLVGVSLLANRRTVTN